MSRDTKYRNIVIDGNTVIGESNEFGSWYNFRAHLPLMFIQHAISDPKALKAVMALADGYGSPGFFPSGYDWSGIRDSTEEAHAAMFETAKKFADFDAFVTLLNAACVPQTCPRCGTPILHKGPPALARFDSHTAICSQCGTDEAIMEYVLGAEILHPINIVHPWKFPPK